MNLTIVYSITEYLARAVTVAYRKAKKDVAKINRKNIAGFSDKLPSYLSIDFNDTDKKLLRNFEQECFTVACVGSYELEEKLKQAAVEILNKPETDTGNRFQAFIKEARDLMDGYLPPKDGKAPQTGWLKTNFQTAVSSAYNASQWQMLHDPAIAGLYPAYQYKTREDARVRDEHRALNNSVYYAHDDIWKSIYPPNGWNCRCYIKYLSQDEIRQPGNEPIELSPEMRTELIKQAKIHPDFNRNSGITGHIFDKWNKAKLKEMPYELRKQISRLASNFAAGVNYSGYNIGDAIEDGEKIHEPVKFFPNKMYESLNPKPVVLYFAKGDAPITLGNVIYMPEPAMSTPLRKKYYHMHEFFHVYHFNHGIITDTYIDSRLEALFEASTKIYRDNKIFLDAFFNYSNRNKVIETILKKDPTLKRDDVTFLMSQSADYINSITRGKAGYGHEPEYWKERNNHFKEWFVHSCEMLHDINFIQKSKLSNFEPVLNKLETLIADINDKKK
jgi:SPP1 gp7 family putative phage head morphogenesis protein